MILVKLIFLDVDGTAFLKSIGVFALAASVRFQRCVWMVKTTR